MAAKDSGIYPVMSKPGIKRDGTDFEGSYYSDGEWVRWQRGLPRKIGGIVQMGKSPGIARGCDVFTKNGNVYIHYGTSGAVRQALTNTMSDLISSTANRTPTGFVDNPDNLWQFAEMYDAGSATTAIIAHAAPNLSNIDNSTTGQIYLNDITTVDKLNPIALSDVSGGIAVLHPYLFYFGSNGLLGWSVANQPTDLAGAGSGEGRVTGGKVLYGTQTRAGAGSAPAGLFWATDALIRATFVGGAPIFDFDRIATSYSILSSQCVVEYDGIYYWIGTNRFMTYNGVIQEIPNGVNRNFFFDNLNIEYRQKVFGMKIAEYGEIWWFWPKGDSTECNHVLIYNIHEGTWYDTPLNRSTGYSVDIYPHPILFDNTELEDGTYNIFKQEEGVDLVKDGFSLAIRSFYETCNFFSRVPEQQDVPYKDGNLQILRFEPDFVLSGTMSMQVRGRKYPQSSPVTIQSEIFTSTTEKIDIREQARIMTLYFESNESGGDYQQGTPLVLMDDGDKRP